MQTDSMREKLFTIRMTEDERERAERVAAHYGLNVAGVIRMLLKREDDTIALHADAERTGKSMKAAAIVSQQLSDAYAKKYPAKVK